MQALLPANPKALEFDPKQRIRETGMRVDTEFLERRIATLECSLRELRRSDPDNIANDIYHAACVKELELVLDQSGKLLCKRLAAYFASNREADRLSFKDLFRQAAHHDLIGMEAVERWLRCRDNRNDTAHDYGENFAETTLKLLPSFIKDATTLADMIESGDDG